MVPLTRVALRSALPPDEVERVRRVLQGIAEITTEPDPETAILVSGRCQDAELDQSRLRAVVVPWAGVPERLVEQLAARPHLALHNLHHNARATAEMAVALLLSAARGVADADRQMRSGVWRGRMTEDRGVLLAGKRATILGYGSIGRCVGEILTALAMDVVGIRRDSRHRLDDALAESHALVICAPLTAETRGLVDRGRIERLRSPRLLVNVGRGPIVDEDALYDACRTKVLFGAGIDVWYSYPGEGDVAPVWPSRHSFQELANVTMSPHRAGDGEGIERLRADALVDLLKDLCLGRARGPVDLSRGY